MKKISGFIVSEVVTYIMIVIVIIAVGIGIYVNSGLDKRIETAQTAIKAIKDRAAAATQTGEKLVCDNSLVDQSLLTNDLISVSVVPAELTEFDPSKGYGVGVQLSSEAKSANKNSFKVTSKLYNSLHKEEKSLLRRVEKDEEKVSFILLVSDDAVCAGTEPQMATDETETESVETGGATVETTSSS